MMKMNVLFLKLTKFTNLTYVRNIYKNYYCLNLFVEPMKIMMVLIFVIVLSFLSLAYAESELFDHIKNNLQQILEKGLTHDKVISVVEELTRQGVLSATFYHDQIVLSNDKKTTFVKLSGQINESGKTGNVVLTITKPDKSNETINASLLETGRYLTYFPVDHNSQKGIYEISAKFGNQDIPTTTFYLTSKKINTTVPLWFYLNFQWWLEEKISDKEFLDSMQFLTDLQIIRVVLSDDDSANGLQVSINGESVVRRGTTHTITTHITDGYNPISGAKVTLRIEDYGENEIRSFEGFSNNNGDFIFSWEVPKSFDDLETLLAFISVSSGNSSQTQIFKFQVYCLPGEKGCKLDGN